MSYLVQLLCMTATSLWSVFLAHSYIIDNPTFRSILTELFPEACKKLLRVGDTLYMYLNTSLYDSLYPHTIIIHTVRTYMYVPLFRQPVLPYPLLPAIL